MPSWLQAIGWIHRPLGFMERNQRRYGDIFTMRIRHFGTWVFLCDPTDIRRVLGSPTEATDVAIANPLLVPLLGSRSVMLLSEPEHMARRRVLLPPFHGVALEAAARTMSEVARAHASGWPIEEPFAIWPKMRAVTQAVVMRSVFGRSRTEHLTELAAHMEQLTEWLNEPHRLSLIGLFGTRRIARNGDYEALMARIEDILLAEVDRCRDRAPTAGGAEQTIIDLLAHTRYTDGSALSRVDLRDELMTLLTDGPTSTSLAWAFERLLHHPDKLARLRRELAAGDDRYLGAVVKETLRLCPPVPVVTRRLAKDMRLGSYTLPAGTTVAPCVHLLHKNGNIYPGPRRFLPERFLDRPPGTYTWIPFGGGVRRCLAASWAEMEMRLVIRAVLETVELRPVHAASKRTARSAISFSPDSRGLVRIERRQHLSA